MEFGTTIIKYNKDHMEKISFQIMLNQLLFMHLNKKMNWKKVLLLL